MVEPINQRATNVLPADSQLALRTAAEFVRTKIQARDIMNWHGANFLYASVQDLGQKLKLPQSAMDKLVPFPSPSTSQNIFVQVDPDTVKSALDGTQHSSSGRVESGGAVVTSSPGAVPAPPPGISDNWLWGIIVGLAVLLAGLCGAIGMALFHDPEPAVVAVPDDPPTQQTPVPGNPFDADVGVTFE